MNNFKIYTSESGRHEPVDDLYSSTKTEVATLFSPLSFRPKGS
ncbi:MAG: hypothetical protein ABEJ25_03615 [Candidatus Bipolaricaulia bacterium]